MLRSVAPSLQLVSQSLVALANQIALFCAREVLFQDKMAAELTTASKMTEKRCLV